MMKLVLLCVVLGLALGQQDTHFFGGGVGGQSSNCRYWCKTPQGQYYCCDRGTGGEKAGSCPPVRLHCPSAYSYSGPQTCSSDYSCAGSDKCCYDTCLGEHVCKPPDNTGVPYSRR
ncbi:uncharacterized protein [Panulirus ornatus]|uniref:uncharacterized protein n=1 Tax=Panulirus ornatus TaxID=150431 RepID=UPI003A87E868